MHTTNPAAVEILTGTINERVAALIPTAQQRILADAFSYARWLTVECASATGEQVVVLRARRPGCLDMLQQLPTGALVSMSNDLRQPPELRADAQCVLVTRYLNDPQTKLRTLSLARQLALDEQRDRDEAHGSFFSRISAGARQIAAAI